MTTPPAPPNFVPPWPNGGLPLDADVAAAQAADWSTLTWPPTGPAWPVPPPPTPPPPLTVPPVISGVTATPDGLGGVSFAWSTDVNSLGLIDYGLTTTYGSTATQATGAGTTSGTATASGLTVGTLYHYRVRATGTTAPNDIEA